MKNKLTLFLFCAFSLVSCTDNLKEQPITTYYNVDSLLNEQLNLLVTNQQLVEKKISIDGEQELDTVSFDSLGWNNELAVFRIADINKPNLKGQYLATEEKTDAYKIWHYTSKKKSLGIEYLHIYFKEGTISKLEARYNEDNALYTSERNLSMTFRPTDNLIQTYSITGSQKMVMKDPVEFSISTRILD